MYYIAEFLNYYPFFRRKMDLFLVERKANFCFNDIHMDFTSKSWEDLSISSNIPWPQNWFIYGSCMKPERLALADKYYLPIPYANGISLSECDEFLQWLAVKYDWAVIPWGGCTHRFNSFVFVSSDEHIRDLFVANHSNIVDRIEGARSEITNTNLLISQHNIENKFSNHCHCVLMHEELREIGTMLWQVCDLNTNAMPWVISYPIDYFDEDGCLDPTDEQAFRCIIGSFGFDVEYAGGFVYHYEFGVYEPRDRDDLVAMLQVHWQEPDALMVVPGNTDLNLLAIILQKTGGYGIRDSYSSLSFSQEILDISQWFYELNSDRNDYKYSMLISRDSQLIRGVDSYCENNNNYRSVAYF
jgi:hypothetical protein